MKKKHKKLEVDPRVVRKEDVQEILAQRPLSFRQIARELGINLKDFSEELAYLERVQRQADRGKPTELCLDTQVRLVLMDVLDDGKRDGTFSVAINPMSEKMFSDAILGPDTVCYYLTAEESLLFDKGLLQLEHRTKSLTEKGAKQLLSGRERERI